eukprot:45050-Ditylum_brightwellii.AAC.2
MASRKLCEVSPLHSSNQLDKVVGNSSGYPKVVEILGIIITLAEDAATVRVEAVEGEANKEGNYTISGP